jgi:hypothetical protein
VKIHEASDFKAARTFLCDKEIEHSRGIHHCLEFCIRFEKCDKRYIRLANSKNWTVFSRQFIAA